MPAILAGAVSRLFLSQVPRDFGVCYRGFPAQKPPSYAGYFEIAQFKEAQNSNISVRRLGSSAQLAR